MRTFIVHREEYSRCGWGESDINLVRARSLDHLACILDPGLKSKLP